MKVLYLHQYFNSPEMPGSTRSYEFAKKMVDLGHTVDVITSDWQKCANVKFSNIDGINVHWAPISYSNKMSFYKRISAFISFIFYSLYIGFKLDYNIVIASSTPLTIGIPALVFKKLRKTKFIFEVRDMWPQIPIAMNFLKSKILIKISLFLEKKIYIEADAIIALSEGMKNEIKKIILKEDKISVITNFCDNKRFRINKISGITFRKNELKINDEPLIVYAGSFGIINNAIYLIDIAYESRKLGYNTKFLLAGGGFQKKLAIKKAKNLDLVNNNVFIFDYFTKKELPIILSAATIISSLFIELPAMENNSANKFFDGLAAGKPIMLNYGGWQSNLINSSGAGFSIPPNNPKKASIIINKIIKDKKKLDLMAECSKKLSNNFKVEQCSDSFFNIVSSTYLKDKL